MVQTDKLQFFPSKTSERKKTRALHANFNFMALFKFLLYLKNGKPHLRSLLLLFSDGCRMVEKSMAIEDFSWARYPGPSQRCAPVPQPGKPAHSVHGPGPARTDFSTSVCRNDDVPLLDFFCLKVWVSVLLEIKRKTKSECGILTTTQTLR